MSVYPMQVTPLSVTYISSFLVHASDLAEAQLVQLLQLALSEIRAHVARRETAAAATKAVKKAPLRPFGTTVVEAAAAEKVVKASMTQA